MDDQVTESVRRLRPARRAGPTVCSAIVAGILLFTAQRWNTAWAGTCVLHLDFNTVQMTKACVVDTLRTAAAAGYDAVLWEVEDKIRWETCPECVHPEAFSKAEFREILAEADRLGLESIPLLQTFGHAEYVLMGGLHPTWLEDPSFPACYCVSKSEVRTFLQRMVREYLEVFGSRVRNFHLGGDEALAFGRCPVCKARNRMDLYVEHLEFLAADLRARGIRPGVWHDMILGAKEENERAKLPRDYTVWYWNYSYDGRGGSCAADVDALGRLGHPVVFSAASASYGDGPFLPRYGFHSKNIAASAALARERSLAGFCVTSWSIRQISKELQLPLWEYGAKRYRSPSADAADDWRAAVSRSFGDLPPETLESMTAWNERLVPFDGSSWFSFIKSARPAPAGTLAKMLGWYASSGGLEAERRKAAAFAGQVRQGIVAVGSAHGADRLREGAELTLAHLAGIDAALCRQPLPPFPDAACERYFRTWQTPLSASNSTAIAGSVFKDVAGCLPDGTAREVASGENIVEVKEK